MSIGDSTTSKSGRTRMRILDGAATMFRARGYNGTRLEDIADSIGMKAGSFYYHFNSKEALAEEVLSVAARNTYERTRKAIEALPSSATSGERVRAALKAHTDVMLESSGYAGAYYRLIGQVPEDMRRRHFEIYQQPIGELWKELIDDAVRSGEIRPDLDPLLVRLLLLGALNWTIEWPARLTQSPEAIANTMIALAFDGLSPREGSKQPARDFASRSQSLHQPPVSSLGESHSGK